MTDVVEIAEVKSAIKENHENLVKAVKDAQAAAENHSDAAVAEIKKEIDSLSAKGSENFEKLADLEQKMAKKAEQASEKEQDFAAQFVGSDAFKDFSEGRQGQARLEIKTAITNVYPASTSQPLVQGDRQAGIVKNPDRVLQISDLLPHIPTSSNLIEYAKESVFSNNAGPQYTTESPTAIENVTKPESGITFTLATTPVVTLAHSLPASKQVLSDSPMLEGYIRSRLIYGLNLEIEDEILNGDGTSGQLDGLLNNASTIAASASGSDTKVDVVRRCLTALQSNEFMGNGIIMNPSDWEDVELTKTTEGAYVFANPQSAAQPRLWGVPVVVTNSIAAGTVLVGDMQQAAAVFDRESLTVEASREHSDNFTKNMVTLLAECRHAIAVWRPSGLVKATF